MKTAIGTTLCCIVLNGVLMGAAGTAFAGAHTWDVNEVFSNASGTIQFVELKETGGGAFETGVPSQTISSNAESFTIGGGPLAPSTALRSFLIATSAFAALPGAPTPDSIVPAGSVPFFATSGDTVSYGPYDSFVFASAPTDGINSRNRLTGIATNSPTNYAGTSGSVDASAGPSVPTLNEWGMALAAGLLLLAGTAVVLRSRARAA